MNGVKSKYCFYCERPFGYPPQNGKPLLKTKDHIIPISKGGRRSFSLNILYCCHECNKLKADKMPEEFANWLSNKIASVKNDTYNRRMHIVILENIRKLIIEIAPVRHKMIRPVANRFSAFRIKEKKEQRPSTPLWWRGLNEK